MASETIYFDENQPIGSVIAKLPATDEDGVALQYEITEAYKVAMKNYIGPVDAPALDEVAIKDGNLVSTVMFDYETDGYVQDAWGYPNWTYEISIKETVHNTVSTVSFVLADELETVTGSASNDTLRGDVGADHISGLSGNDWINGYIGNDRIIGGLGRDTMAGGAGADTFVFKSIKESTVAAADRILDLEHDDRIDLSSIDANTKISGNQDFDWIAKKAFTGHAGELRYEKTDDHTMIYADVNGDKKADFAIELTHATNLASGYFIL